MSSPAPGVSTQATSAASTSHVAATPTPNGHRSAGTRRGPCTRSSANDTLGSSGSAVQRKSHHTAIGAEAIAGFVAIPSAQVTIASAHHVVRRAASVSPRRARSSVARYQSAISTSLRLITYVTASVWRGCTRNTSAAHHATRASWPGAVPVARSVRRARS